MAKYLPVSEFRSFGYLHEVNRRLLHPLGLALEVTIDDEGNEFLSGVWDYRDDPEGIVMDEVDGQKITNIDNELIRRRPAREALLGHVVQTGLEEIDG